jgi:hypothetical protein
MKWILMVGLGGFLALVAGDALAEMIVDYAHRYHLMLAESAALIELDLLLFFATRFDVFLVTDRDLRGSAPVERFLCRIFHQQTTRYVLAFEKLRGACFDCILLNKSLHRTMGFEVIDRDDLIDLGDPFYNFAVPINGRRFRAVLAELHGVMPIHSIRSRLYSSKSGLLLPEHDLERLYYLLLAARALKSNPQFTDEMLRSTRSLINSVIKLGLRRDALGLDRLLLVACLSRFVDVDRTALLQRFITTFVADPSLAMLVWKSLKNIRITD